MVDKKNSYFNEFIFKNFFFYNKNIQNTFLTKASSQSSSPILEIYSKKNLAKPCLGGVYTKDKCIKIPKQNNFINVKYLLERNFKVLNKTLVAKIAAEFTQLILLKKLIKKSVWFRKRKVTILKFINKNRFFTALVTLFYNKYYIFEFNKQATLNSLLIQTCMHQAYFNIFAKKKIFYKLKKEEKLSWCEIQNYNVTNNFSIINKMAFKFLSRFKHLLIKGGKGTRAFVKLVQLVSCLKPSFKQKLRNVASFPTTQNFVFLKIAKKLNSRFTLRKYTKGRRTIYFPGVIPSFKILKPPTRWFNESIKINKTKKSIKERLLSAVWEMETNKRSVSLLLKKEFLKSVNESKVNLKNSRGTRKWRKISWELELERKKKEPLKERSFRTFKAERDKLIIKKEEKKKAAKIIEQNSWIERFTKNSCIKIREIEKFKLANKKTFY